jgi:aminoglycoside phosphotransferase (APT) family kinase protein
VIVGDDLGVRAVLDWEMATIGDPLADIGLLIVYWDGLTNVDNPITTGMGPQPGSRRVRTWPRDTPTVPAPT